MAAAQAQPRLSGKTALVTGSTGGMGAGIAARLASEGAALVVSGRRESEGQAVAAGIRAGGGQAVFVRADVSIENECVSLLRAAVEAWGRLDILVNNAAVTPNELVPLTSLGGYPKEAGASVDDQPGMQSAELWDQVFAVNTRGAFLCSREAIPVMRRQGGGRIINIGSTVPFRGGMDRLAYGCSKGALWFMTKMMARELVKDRILVNWVSVGWVATPGEIALRDQLHGDGLAFLEARGQSAPLGRLETVEEIAAGVAYLASDEASHVTGCDLNISGGLYIG